MELNLGEYKLLSSVSGNMSQDKKERIVQCTPVPPGFYLLLLTTVEFKIGWPNQEVALKNM